MAHDISRRFIFDQTDIRGEIVTVNNGLKELIGSKAYPPYAQQLLGEFVAATALISNFFNFEGLLILQARGDGPIPLIMAEINHHHQMRAIARLSDEAVELDHPYINLPELIGRGVLSITFEPVNGKRYQGIVPLEAPSLADCLECYFVKSEQLPTKLWLSSDGAQAGGLMLQQLPQQVADQQANRFAWENRVQLVNTVTSEELLNVEQLVLLNRLFHEEGVRVFEPVQLFIRCSCSKERSSQALRHLGREDVESLLQEQGTITVDCEFCGHRYTYDEQDVARLFAVRLRH